MKKSRVLSGCVALLLAMVMTLSCAGVTVLAASDDEVADAEMMAEEKGRSADVPMNVGAEALVYDSSKGIVGFSKTWYDSLNRNGDTLYVSLTIPEEMNGIPVTKIAYQALQYKNNGFRNETDVLKDELKNIKIVSVDFTQAVNLTEIGPFAFDQRTELTGEVDLSNTQVKTIGAGAFRGTAITGAILRDDLQELGDVDTQAGAFAQCSQLSYVRTASSRNSSEAVVLPESLTTIGKQCFRYSFKKGSRIAITIPASVEKIGSEAFNACGDGNYGEICQLNVMRTSDFSGYDTYAFKGSPKYPAIYASGSAYQAAKNSKIKDGNNSATMTYVVDVNFKYNETVIKTEQKLYNMYLLYEKDANGLWNQKNDYSLPVPDGVGAGMTVDWKYATSGEKVAIDDKLKETETPVVIVANKAVPEMPVIHDVLTDPESVHEDGTITLSLDLAELPEGMNYAYEWIMYDSSEPDGQRAMGNESTLTLTYEETKDNYFAVGVSSYLVSDKQTVSEQAVYGWFTIPTTAHSWPEDWTMDREATADEDGLQHKTCTVANCGKTIWENIPASESPVSGNITKAVEIGSGAPQTELLNTREELSGLLEDKEKQSVDSGSHARIWLEVQKLASMPKEDAEKITEKSKTLLGENATVLPFDISLYVKVDQQAQRKITETDTPIKIVLTVPEELRETIPGLSRQWYLVRVHNGQAEQIDGEYDAQLGAITIETDRFSTYAFVYADVYTVTFDGNGASGRVSEPMKVGSGASFTAPNAGEMKRIGYHFVGWGKQNDAEAAEYSAGETVTDISTDTTLYAVWERNTYRVAFHANGGAGTMEEQEFIYGDEPKKLQANVFTRTGYIFLGWATEQKGDVVYNDTEQVKDLTKEQGEIVNLYAVWKANTQKPGAAISSGTTTVSGTTATPGTQTTSASKTASGRNRKVNTGDTSNLGLMFAILLISGGTVVLLYKRKTR